MENESSLATPLLADDINQTPSDKHGHSPVDQYFQPPDHVLTEISGDHLVANKPDEISKNPICDAKACPGDIQAEEGGNIQRDPTSLLDKTRLPDRTHETTETGEQTDKQFNNGQMGEKTDKQLNDIQTEEQTDKQFNDGKAGEQTDIPLNEEQTDRQLGDANVTSDDVNEVADIAKNTTPDDNPTDFGNEYDQRKEKQIVIPNTNSNADSTLVEQTYNANDDEYGCVENDGIQTDTANGNTDVTIKAQTDTESKMIDVPGEGQTETDISDKGQLETDTSEKGQTGTDMSDKGHTGIDAADRGKTDVANKGQTETDLADNRQTETDMANEGQTDRGQTHKKQSATSTSMDDTDKTNKGQTETGGTVVTNNKTDVIHIEQTDTGQPHTAHGESDKSDTGQTDIIHGRTHMVDKGQKTTTTIDNTTHFTDMGHTDIANAKKGMIEQEQSGADRGQTDMEQTTTATNKEKTDETDIANGKTGMIREGQTETDRTDKGETTTATNNSKTDLTGRGQTGLTKGQTDETTVEADASAHEGDEVIEVEQVKEKRLIYKVSERPPLRLLLIFTLQQGLLPVSAALSVSVLVTEVVCGRDDGEFRTQILSSTFFMIGLSTFCMSTFGVRLPIFQGPSSPYIIPLLALSSMPEWRCPNQQDLAQYYSNMSMNISGDVDGLLPVPKELIYSKVQMLSGSLLVAGAVHFLIGVTGLVGFMLRFIGPITIVPAITLVGLYIYKITVRFSETSWPVAILVASTGVILSLYLSKRSTPIPAWSRSRGFHLKWFPIHQVFAILIAIIIGWGTSAVMTHYDLLSADRDSVQFYARTDTQLHVIHNTPWFSFPYPGQYGPPSFHGGVFLSFFLATLLSVLDSIGDYNACARMCIVPAPPAWAVNRGIAVEGLMSALSGGFGVGHATVSYGGNIGAIGLTKVASRSVFQLVGLLYVMLAVVSKVGAVFITVPYSVLGGTQILTIGIFIGIVLSNLQSVDLRSTRNVAIIGVSLLLGLMVPYWVAKTEHPIDSGNEDADRLIAILLSNPVFVGGFLACFLDNTVPGTRKERGIVTEEDLAKGDDDDAASAVNDVDKYEEGLEVYHLPWLPDWLQYSKLAKVIRIFPGNTTPAASDQEKGNLLASEFE